MIFVDRSLLGLLWPLLDDVHDRHALRGDGRRQGRRARRPRRRPSRPRLRGRCWPRAEPVEFDVDGREPGRVDVLHERHHRQPQGRRLLATARRTCTRWAAMTADSLGVRETRRDPAGRADVPRQRLGPGPRRRGRRRHPRDARARPVAAGHRRPDRGARRSPSPPACRRSGWACCPSSKGRDIVGLRAIPCGGSAVPKALSEGYREPDRPADPPGLGHDRDQPGRVGRPHQAHARPTCTDDELADLRTTRRASSSPGVDFRVVDPAPLERAAVGRREPAASCRCAGPWIARDVLQRRPLGRVVHRRRLAADRRRGHRRPRGLHPPRRPHQGRGEVRRRVDQLGRARERDHGPPQGGRGRRHRRHPPEVGRAAAGLRGGEAGRGRSPRRSCSTFLDGRVAKWWLPDDVVFIDEVPKTSVGKFSKKDLRERFADYELPTA